MPKPENLKLRLRLIAKFDSLSARLADGDQTAIESAHLHIGGLLACNDCDTLGLIMKALGRVLEDMQEEIDTNKYHW